MGGGERGRGRRGRRLRLGSRRGMKGGCIASGVLGGWKDAFLACFSDEAWLKAIDSQRNRKPRWMRKPLRWKRMEE